MPRGVHLGWSKETDPDSFCFQGYINLGTSENKLCLDLIKERVSHVLDSAETRTLWVWFPDLYLGLWQVQGENIDIWGMSETLLLDNTPKILAWPTVQAPCLAGMQ